MSTPSSNSMEHWKLSHLAAGVIAPKLSGIRLCSHESEVLVVEVVLAAWNQLQGDVDFVGVLMNVAAAHVALVHCKGVKLSAHRECDNGVFGAGSPCEQVRLRQRCRTSILGVGL